MQYRNKYIRHHFFSNYFNCILFINLVLASKVKVGTFSNYLSTFFYYFFFMR